ncbi:xanthine dehydrogenase family protein molybdopterin-binding subunit [candidate division KSB1 bacterium]|nr:xanthine dehydrogenase family protein molybdopterin-binding subunit [candidate division KSB1 bacterium]
MKMKNDDYMELDFRDNILQFPLNRRDFLKRFCGGLVVLFTIGDAELLAQRGRRDYPSDFNAYLLIGADGRVACLTGKIEMGQGIITSLAQMLADELDVSIDSVDMVMGDTDRSVWDMGTFGSLTTRHFGPYMRKAAAEARAVLIELAAEQLNVAISKLTVEDGIVFEKGNRDRRISYAQLTKGKIIERHVSGDVAIKDKTQYKIMGKSFLRRDALEKVKGEAKYAGDIRLPDMLYAKVLRPPAHDAKLISVDTSKAEKVEGAIVIRENDLIAVLHKHPDIADKARALIKAEYDTPQAKVDEKSIFDYLLNYPSEKEIISQAGDVAQGAKLAAETFETTFYDGYVAHAPMETHTAIVDVKGNKATAWVGTQRPFAAKDSIAEALGFPAEKVHVLTPFVGGGFGGKSPHQQAVEAARLSKITGKPVQVAWNRAEEFFYDTFRPAAVVKIKSGISDSGAIVTWDYQVYFAGDRGAEHFYEIPNYSTSSYNARGAHPFATGPWRAPANNTNTFARESQIDIMAAKAGIDPMEFRLKNLKHEQLLTCLKTAADKFGYTPAKPPSGRGIGIALGIDADTFVATIAQVDVNRDTGHVQVKRVVCAQDMGLCVNPEGAIIQMEGCITMGLGYALTEDIHFEGGHIIDTNFDAYELPRFSWLPQIETVIIDSKDPAAHGGGEPAIITMGGAIANAIYDAIGVRVSQMPMSPERIKAALKNG